MFLFGAAYYEEYLPYDRLEDDMKMMRKAGFTCIRIAESTWSTLEPEPGRFDFSHIDRVLLAAERYGLSVIVGTPTYAVPVWLTRLDPEVLVHRKDGQAKYGARQNMDIMNGTFRHYAERVIRQLVRHTAEYRNVIGYQLDNETKHYGTSGENVQAFFREHLKEQFGEIDKLNQAFGFAYWSNSVSSFDELPDVNGAVNGSYLCAFEAFQRSLAAEYLAWQASIVTQEKRDDQFLTHNFDFDWKAFGAPGTQDGFSHGLQPDICHFDAAKALTVAGTDVYHPTQDELTGMEIAFAGDEIRSLKQKPYLVLETQAQAFRPWTPYPGQLRLQAISHIASGAAGLLYWNWHSIHNGLETYWKGLLSHDFGENPTYEEACRIGREIRELQPEIEGLVKCNRIAVMVSNESLTALKYFPTDKDFSYNDALLLIYGALYEMNAECDIIYPQSEDWETRYDCILTPNCYCVTDSMIARFRDFVSHGGVLISFCRSFFADENVKVYHDKQPHGMTDVFGMTYNQYTEPKQVTVAGFPAKWWMEFLVPDTAQTMSFYEHPYWSRYAAVTKNRFGRGLAYYIGTYLEKDGMKTLLRQILKENGLLTADAEFPFIMKKATNEKGGHLLFLLNFSAQERLIPFPLMGKTLLTGDLVRRKKGLVLPSWGAAVWEEKSDAESG